MMSDLLRLTFLETESDWWAADIERLRRLLGAPNNPFLFPPHFLKSAFPKIGGRALTATIDEQLAGVGFLFPRHLQNDTRVYTLRFHHAGQRREVHQGHLAQMVEDRLDGDKVVFYDPQADQGYDRTSQRQGDLTIGQPDVVEAHGIRGLQQEIWGSQTDFLYPADLHSADFRAATSLVVRSGQPATPVGFLFGFYKFAIDKLPPVWQQKIQTNFRVESQLLGVQPDHRRHGLGFLLKKLQGEKAQSEDIDIVNWTVDPLLYGNAVLNFGRLRAVAFNFYPAYYNFQNALNRAPASRLELVWLVNSERVKQALSTSAEATIRDLNDEPAIYRVNAGWATLDLDVKSPKIAIEIPAHWTALQKEQPQEALKWRTTTDQLFQHYLGADEGKYIITGVAAADERVYLVADRVDTTLLNELAS